MSDYRKLRFYQRARALGIRVHQLVEKLPAIERTRRGDQLIRAANSIRNNIAEGATSGSKPQYAKFLQYSISSANEVQDEIQDLADVTLLPAEDADLLSEPSEIAAMIATYRKKIIESIGRKRRARS
jgi:four helix bundle protein